MGPLIKNPLKRARSMTTLSQENVAERLGVHRQTLARWEADDFDPSELPLKTLEILRDLYGQESVTTLTNQAS